MLENICNHDYSEIENDKNLCKIWLKAIWEFPKFPEVIKIISFYSIIYTTKIIKIKGKCLKIKKTLL